MFTTITTRNGVIFSLILGLMAAGVFGSVRVADAEGTNERPGWVPCFEKVQPMLDHATIGWALPEDGGPVKKWIVWAKPANKDEMGPGQVKRVKSQKREVTFRNLTEGYWTLYVRGKNDAGKGPRNWVRVFVGPDVTMISASKMCD